ncbi:hypothetical protein N9Y26_00270 [bacterium]|nr:hypothetical protein [bacterium]
MPQGGFTGKGFLNGTQTKFNFVPEQDSWVQLESHPGNARWAPRRRS